MTQFEFILIAVSIVMALGMSRLLDVLGPALRPDRRSWIHVGWLVQKFFNHLFWWWTLWVARDTNWDLPLYFFSFAGPVVLYLQASALSTPSEEAPMSWQQRFFEIRIPFFLGNLALVAIIVAAQAIFDDLSGGVPPILFLGLLAIVGLVTTNIRTHGVIIILALTAQMLGLGAAFVALTP